MPEDLKNSLFGKLSLFLKYGLTNDRDKGLAVVDEVILNAAETQPFVARDIAGYYGMIGEIETAVRNVEKAINLGYLNYPFLAFHHPFYSPLRMNAKFIELMDVVKEKWSSLEI